MYKLFLMNSLILDPPQPASSTHNALYEQHTNNSCRQTTKMRPTAVALIESLLAVGKLQLLSNSTRGGMTITMHIGLKSGIVISAKMSIRKKNTQKYINIIILIIMFSIQYTFIPHNYIMNHMAFNISQCFYTLTCQSTRIIQDHSSTEKYNHCGHPHKKYYICRQ